LYLVDSGKVRLRKSESIASNHRIMAAECHHVTLRFLNLPATQLIASPDASKSNISPAAGHHMPGLLHAKLCVVPAPASCTRPSAAPWVVTTSSILPHVAGVWCSLSSVIPCMPCLGDNVSHKSCVGFSQYAVATTRLQLLLAQGCCCNDAAGDASLHTHLEEGDGHAAAA